MVSCLTLIGESHWRLSQQGGLHITACGLALAAQHIEPHTFATDATGTTCKNCLAVSPSALRPAPAASSRPTPKALLARLVDEVLNANDTTALPKLAQGRLAATLAQKRLNRLHELFPTWCMTVEDVIAEGDSVFARYRVACVDAFGLLGAAGPVEKPGQALIARLSGEHLADVRAVVDDFGIWAGPSPVFCETHSDADRCTC